MVREILHHVAHARQAAVFFKIDFAKAFDSINWEFLIHVMHTRGFPCKWIRWIQILLQTSTSRVIINGEESEYFSHKRGLRQGDPLSPMLFLIAVDVLQRMIIQVNETLDRPLSAKLEKSILAFQYANDTAVIARADLPTMITLKLVLRLFSKISGLQINFDKSSFYPLNLDQNETLMVKAVMRCAQTQLPISYLGMPLTIRKPRKQDFIPLLDKIQARTEGWCGKFLSKGGRVQLINSVLSSMPIYLMTCFELPKWVVKRIEALCRNFLWGKSQVQGRGISLISWEVVSLPKSCGGLGVANLELRNKSLLLRWWWKATTQSESLWYSVIHMLKKNRPHQTHPKIWLVQGSFFWNQLIKLQPLFQWCTMWIIGNGARISYWYDCWGSEPLRRMKDGRPRPIYQHLSLNEALSEDSDIISSYTGTEPVPVLYDHDDALVWRWSTNGEYSAASVYKMLIMAGKTHWGFMEIWSAAAPSKVKIFTFLLLKDRILTRDGLQRRGINCEEHCVLCDERPLETVHHLFFQCQNAREVWAQCSDIMQSRDLVSEIWESSRLLYCSKEGNQRQDWVVNFMAVLWSLWRQRNEVIFRGSKVPPWLVASRADEDTKLWLRFCSKRKLQGSGTTVGRGTAHDSATMEIT